MSAPVRSAQATRWYRSRARQRPVSTEQSKEMADSAWIISSRLMAGVLLYAGLGWLLSLWIGHRPLLIAVGMVVGLGLSYYLVFSGLARDAKRDKE